MKTVKNEELIAQILQELDMSKEELAYFIESLNEVFIKQLIDKKEVIVEGLGEFRLVWSNHHKNQKLDDSSPLQYYKLKFEPDSSLKELINKDFSFLPIVDLSRENAINMPINILSKQAEEIKDILSEIQDNTNRGDIVTVNTVKQNVADVVYGGRDDLNSVQTPNHVADDRESAKDSPQNSREEESTATIDHQPRPHLSATNKDDNIFTSEPKRGKKWLWYSIAGVIAVVCAVLLLIIKPRCGTYDKTHSITTIDSISPPSNLATIDSTSELTDTLFFEKREYLDFIDTVRVKQGVTLVRLALEYYGDKRFWVYIYEANKDVIPQANRINIGTRIYIPRMEEKYLNQQDTFIINKVKKLGYYYGK